MSTDAQRGESPKTLKSRRGGARPGAGRKKGTKWPSTITKERAREALRVYVLGHFKPLVDAQIENAKGISHFFLRDAKTGRFELVTDEKAILTALNSGQEGSHFYVYTKDPSIQAFTDLMNRTLDKPREQEIAVNLTGDADLLARLDRGRQRVAEARAQRGGQ